MINQQEEEQLRSQGVPNILMLAIKGKAINIFQCLSEAAGSGCNSLSRGRPRENKERVASCPVLND